MCIYVNNYPMSVEKKLVENCIEEPMWFAMSATFGRGLKAQTFLDSKSVECFVPMKYQIVNDKKKGKIKMLVPAINNLIFVHTTKDRIQALKSEIGYLQYLTQTVGGKNIPIVVPEDQMQQFIKVCNTHDDNLVYLAPDEINLEKGTPVKIIGGTFDGVTGTFIKVDKYRKKRVVVYVQGIAAVMVMELTDEYIQVLE